MGRVRAARTRDEAPEAAPGGRGSFLSRRIEALRKKESRHIVGIETGGTPGKLGAALIEVSGSGDETALYLLGYVTRLLNPEVQVALMALERDERFDSEELAGINFLLLHHISRLYEEVLESTETPAEQVDCIGLGSLDVGGLVFPADPGVLSEMTGTVVASHFRIGVRDGDGRFLDVEEPLLQGILSEMIDRFGLDEEVREAVTVALLANESIFNEDSSICKRDVPKGEGKRREGLKAAIGSEPARSDRKASLCGEFYFPV
jgi:hypothetical protein